ncbi:MAG: zf-HC2 domain-containing protein [Deltaproteobacteria bacterium]|nr:zf-HC2 domain-containing protein [Deltaproteobacteria bacterium]
MTCRECNEFLLDYRSGDLAPKEHTCVEAHLAWCSRCVVFLRHYEETVRLVKAAFNHSNESRSAIIPESLVQTILAVARGMRH